MRIAPLSPWSLSAAALALALTTAAWTLEGGALFAPASLSAVPGDSLGGVRSHAGLGSRCGACHVAPWSTETMDGKCLACHADVRAELGDSTRLHGTLADAEACRSCHTEHHGATASLTRMDMSAREHARFGFSLATHRETSGGEPFRCADCHAPESFRFEDASCASCHRDYQPRFVTEHVATWGEDCRACHDGTSETGSAFDHARTKFALVGAHIPVACNECHLPGRMETPAECVSCHRDDDEHRGALGPDCAACHTAESWERVTFEHTFPVAHGSRTPSECAVCHQDAPRNYERYTCYGCHEHTPDNIRREHADENVSAQELPDCVKCHEGGGEHGEGRRGGDRDSH